MSDPYLLTPINRPDRARYIRGPRLGPSYDDLRRQLEQTRERLDNECALRVREQERLNKAARVLAAIGWAYPGLRRMVEQARRDIWGSA